MEQVLERVCGLDVHKASVAACVRIPNSQGTSTHEVRTFGTTTGDLLALRDWLTAHGVTHVALESTGVFWKPVFYLLEDQFHCLLVNPTHIKQVPGRKTDVQDCAWLAQLLAHGLLRGSFVPPAPIRDLRDLTRYRTALLQERTREANRVHKLLQDAGIKLSSVATDILGVSGRAMLNALLEGTTDPQALAELARGKLRRKLPALRAALAGHFRPHHAFLLAQLLTHLDRLDELIAGVSARIDELLAPFAEARAHLDTIPGVGPRTADILLAETGGDMRPFPTEHHLASWAGLCPGNNESAGKRKSGRTRKGNRWLRSALTEAALAAIGTHGSALAARYRRLRHRGHRKAVVAIAHAILRAAYHVLAHHTPYADPGSDYFARRDAERAVRRAVQTLERQGYRVVLDRAA